MKIAIIGPSPIPYTRGGIENFLAGLYKVINDQTEHSAELIKIPIREDGVFPLLKAYWTFHRLNLDHFDLIISSKYPSWMTRHPNHILYLGHRLRGLYDTYPDDQRKPLWKSSFFQFPGPWVRHIIHRLDHWAFSPKRISHVYAFSKTVASRSDYFHPDMPPTVVYCSTTREDYFCAPGKFFFTVSRLDAPKRIDLIINAYRHVHGNIPLLIAGSGPQDSYLRFLAKTDERIQFLGAVSESHLLEYYASSLAVPYVPIQEDYGLITLEAMKSRKPVITAADSGGPLEFIVDGVNGFVAEPTPIGLAEKMNRIVQDPDLAQKMGEKAAETVSGIRWENTIVRILSPYQYWPERKPRQSGDRRRIMVLVPYPVHPPQSGGPRRVASLYHELSKVYDVWILSVGRLGAEQQTREINPYLHEVCIPITPRHAEAQWKVEQEIGVAVSDILLPQLLKSTPNFQRAVDYFLACSDIAIASHPYLYPLCRKTMRCRFIIHESHNFEWDLKKTFLSKSAPGNRLLRKVHHVEKAAIQGSDMVTFTSQNEADQLRNEYHPRNLHSVVVPNGVDTQDIQPFHLKERNNARTTLKLGMGMICLFMGAWHPPNLEAFCYIKDNLAPLLPDVYFVVIGSVTAQYNAQIGELQTPQNMRVFGEVDDTMRKTVLAAADIGLNPMFSGSGTNLKILEYWAAGLAVVSTSVGVRGLAMQPGVEALVIDPEQFPDAIRALSRSEPDRLKLGNAGRQLVVSHYSWYSIAANLIGAIEKNIPRTTSPTVSVTQSALFRGGWYPLERWPDGDNHSYLDVRWSEPRAEIMIPDVQGPAVLRMNMLGGPVATPLKLYLDDQELMTIEVDGVWQPVSITIHPRIGADWRELRLETPGWTPSAMGSPDTRILGVAVSKMFLEHT